MRSNKQSGGHAEGRRRRVKPKGLQILHDLPLVLVESPESSFRPFNIPRLHIRPESQKILAPLSNIRAYSADALVEIKKSATVCENFLFCCERCLTLLLGSLQVPCLDVVLHGLNVAVAAFYILVRALQLCSRQLQHAFTNRTAG